ncbi:hypothetical protein BKA62DRAFT_760353 [Auriculariales sp. MPI-PUGE-AT-0066]|nr:hypothetical protein BKA62DRAFT_760353 [Auriculariales sp. MPI-PUGE-AT-0066]
MATPKAPSFDSPLASPLPALPTIGRPQRSAATASLKSNLVAIGLLLFSRVLYAQLEGWGWFPEWITLGAIGRFTGYAWIAFFGFTALNAAFTLYSITSPPPPSSRRPPPGTPRVAPSPVKTAHRPLEGISKVTPRQGSTYSANPSMSSPLRNSISAASPLLASTQGPLQLGISRRASNIFAPSSSLSASTAGPSSSILGASGTSYPASPPRAAVNSGPLPFGPASVQQGYGGPPSTFGNGNPVGGIFGASTASAANSFMSSATSTPSANDSPLAYRVSRSMSSLGSSTVGRPVDNGLLRQFLQASDD